MLEKKHAEADEAEELEWRKAIGHMQENGRMHMESIFPIEIELSNEEYHAKFPERIK